MTQPAGWYTNPDGTASQRFWDGTSWTHEVRPNPSDPVAEHRPELGVGGAAGGLPADSASAVGGLLAGHDASPAAAPDPVGQPLSGGQPLAASESIGGGDPGPIGGRPVGNDPAATGGGAYERTMAVGGAPASTPAAAMETPSTAAPSSAQGSIGELFGILFDFGLQRSYSAATARLGYLIGTVAVGVISLLMLVNGLQAGGQIAVVSILVFPLMALQWLIFLRGIMQLVRDRANDASAKESDPGRW